MNAHLQNDPDRAGGLIADAQGEFVQQESGGAFDPRAFREDTRDAPAEPRTDTQDASPEPRTDTEDNSAGPGRPPVDDEYMAGPREEIDKAR